MQRVVRRPGCCAGRRISSGADWGPRLGCRMKRGLERESAGGVPGMERNVRPHPNPLPLGRGRAFDRERAARQLGVALHLITRPTADEALPRPACIATPCASGVASRSADSLVCCFADCLVCGRFAWERAHFRWGGTSGKSKVCRPGSRRLTRSLPLPRSCGPLLCEQIPFAAPPCG